MANSSVPGTDFGNEAARLYGAALPVTYCLLGNGDVLGKKFKINRILSPSSTSEDKYEKVQVEVLNIGSDNIDDATLELWADNERVATEKIHTTIKSQETYKYTFEKRVDCSVPEFTISK
ncbi:MAG: CARDB domain-containing protein [Barnesiella sp.]